MIGEGTILPLQYGKQGICSVTCTHEKTSEVFQVAVRVLWPAFFAALAEVNYQGCVTIESFDPSMERIAKLCCIWRKLADSPEQLATEGLRFLKTLL